MMSNKLAPTVDENGSIPYADDGSYDPTRSRLKEAEEMYGDVTTADNFGYVSRGSVIP